MQLQVQLDAALVEEQSEAERALVLEETQIAVDRLRETIRELVAQHTSLREAGPEITV